MQRVELLRVLITDNLMKQADSKSGDSHIGTAVSLFGECHAAFHKQLGLLFLGFFHLGRVLTTHRETIEPSSF